VLRGCILAALGLLIGCRPGAPTQTASHGEARAPDGVAVKPFRFSNPDWVLLITGGTDGMLEVCNCAGPMPGGLARRSGLIRSYRAAFANTLLLDTGDVFWVDPADLRNDFVLKGYARIGYDVVVLGDQELAAGANRLRALTRIGGAKYLATTVTSGRGDFPREVLYRRGDQKLAIVSDLRRDALRFVPPQRTAELTLAKPADLADRIGRLKKAGFLVVVAAHMEADTIEDTAAACEGDLILRGHTSRSDPKVRRIGGRPVLRIGGFQTVGVVAIRAACGKIVDMDYRVEVVDTSWPLDRRLIQTYQAYAHAAMRQALDAPRRDGLVYVPSAACGRCHRRQHAAWRAGPHARAYKGLAKARRTGDPNCLMCHTTGFGVKGGFIRIEKTPGLAGVHCQNCHRHNAAEHRRKGFTVPRVTKDVCTTCHTPVTDPKFVFRRKLPTIRCPKGVAVSKHLDRAAAAE